MRALERPRLPAILANTLVFASGRSKPLTTPDQLSVYEILKHKQLVLLEGAVEPVETRLK